MRLADVANIRKTVNDPATEIAMVNNQQAVVIATRMLPNLRIDQWSASVRQALDDFKVTKYIPGTKSLPNSIMAESIRSGFPGRASP